MCTFGTKLDLQKLSSGGMIHHYKFTRGRRDQCCPKNDWKGGNYLVSALMYVTGSALMFESVGKVRHNADKDRAESTFIGLKLANGHAKCTRFWI